MQDHVKEKVKHEWLCKKKNLNQDACKQKHEDFQGQHQRAPL